MASFLEAKTPDDVVERLWALPIDGVQSVVATGTSVAVDESVLEDDVLSLVLSGGTAGETASITVVLTTSEGTTYYETLYVPVIATAAQIADTARDYCTFALRKILGIDAVPDSGELAHALECLTALVADWRKGGADIGCAFPITADTVIYCPDWAVSALRYNLLVEAYGVFGEEPIALDVMKARQGLQRVRQSNVPDTRAAEFF